MKKKKSVEIEKLPKGAFRLTNLRMNGKRFYIGEVRVINETKNKVVYDIKLPHVLTITLKKKRSPLKHK